MFSNLGTQFTSDVALQVAQRNVTTNGTPIDCEPAPAATKPDQARLEAKYRFVFFTVMVGAITDGNHVVSVETSSAAAGPFTEVAKTGPLAANTAQVLSVRRDAASGQKFVRLNHIVSGAPATGAVVGGVIHRPKVIDAKNDIDLEQVMRQCMYAVGAGAGMPIHAEALERVCLHVRDGFFSALNKPGVKPPAAWNAVKHFLLACCEEIGTQAAADAFSRALIAIPFRVDDPVTGNIIGGLAKAYNDVSTNNDTSGGAGEYCPSNVGN